MQDQMRELFRVGLGLSEPWKVSKIEFSAEQQQLDLWVYFPAGSRFACPEMRAVGLRRPRQRRADLAAPVLLSAQDVAARPPARRALRGRSYGGFSLRTRHPLDARRLPLGGHPDAEPHGWAVRS
jgi:hypothetical protein